MTTGGELLSLRMLLVGAPAAERDLWLRGAGGISVPVDLFAQEPAEARTTLERQGADICIVDAALPEQTRAAVIAAARSTRPAPLVFVCGTAPQGGDRVDGVLRRPTNLAEAKKFAELCVRTRLPTRVLERLADADAFGSLGLSRRDALWAAKALGRVGDRDDDLPLFTSDSSNAADSIVGRGTPFDDVDFVDTANLANKATQDVKDVYQMVADTLFEDFASADFANRKRSVAVNQQQHKLGPYNPRVPEQRFGDMRLSYSKVYSAFGQAVLDTQQSLREDIRAYELAALMVKAFFGLVAADGTAARRATDQERDAFMRDQMGMAEHPFTEFPDFKKGTVDVTPFQEYALTDMLLLDKDQRSLLERVESKVQLEMDRIMASYDLKLWREKVVELLPNLERDAIREAGATAETSEDRIKRHTGELLAQLRLNVRGRLYMLLDDRKQGGLEFVLSLLEQVKARLAQRDLANVQRNGKRYRDVRDALRTRQVEESLNHLTQAAGRLFGKDAQAREIMNHLKRDIADYLRFHLLAVAAGQSIEVMQSLSGWLGEPQAPDEHGQVRWSGVAGEFQEGRRNVGAMLAAVDQRIGQLRADARQEHATYIKLASDVLPEPVRLTGDVSAWSEDVLLEFGGSARLFPQLGDERLRSDLLLKLFRRAQLQLSGEQAVAELPIHLSNAWARCRRRSGIASSRSGSRAPCRGLTHASRPSSRPAPTSSSASSAWAIRPRGAGWSRKSAPPCPPASFTATLCPS